MEQLNDGGWKSRKLWFAVYVTQLILVVAILSAKFLPAMAPLFETIVGGFIGTFLILVGGNLGGKLSIGKAVAWGNQIPADETTTPSKSLVRATPKAVQGGTLQLQDED